MIEIKYEAVFGDQLLFNDVSDKAVIVIKNNDSKYVITEHESSDYFHLSLCQPDSYIAMRRIIKMPVWTQDDKDVGRLPEVGCKCVGILSEAIKRVVHVNKHIVAVENEKTLNVCNFTHEEFFRNHKPIETPAEKAQRLEDEFVESTCRQNEQHSTLYSDGVRAAYRKLKGGE